MMEDKIIFAIKPITMNEEYHYIASFIGSSSQLKKGLKKYGYESKDFTGLYEKINEVLKEGKEGKFIIDDAIIFVLPESFTRLHTQQNPLIILKGMTDVIDIDEWWYSPFREMISNAQVFNYTKNNKDWNNTEYREDNLQGGSIVRFKMNTDDSEWLYAINCKNITFDLV